MSAIQWQPQTPLAHRGPSTSGSLASAGIWEAPLGKTIIAVATLFGGLIILAIIFRGISTRTLALPWVIPAFDGILIFIALSITFLAFGRYQALSDPLSFWVVIGFSGFGVGMLFHFLTFPAILPSGHSILNSTLSSPAWAIFVSQTIIAVSLLLASRVHWPSKPIVQGKFRLLLSAWLIGVTLTHGLMVMHAKDLPGLIGPTRVFNRLTSSWHLLISILCLVGAIISARKSFQTREALFSYVALCQLSLFSLTFMTLFGLSVRFGIWWYIQWIGWVGGFCFVQLGLLREYVYLFRREQEKVWQIRESEAELKEAQRIAQMGSWSWDILADKVFWSEECYRIMGFDARLPAPDFQREHQKLYTRESYGRLSDAVTRTIETGTPYELELELTLPDGERRWVVVRGEPDESLAGRAIRLHGTIQDITERKRIGNQVLLNEAKLKAVFDTAPVGILVVNEKGELEYMNKAGQEIWGGLSTGNYKTVYAAYRGWFFDTGKPLEAKDWAHAQAFVKGEKINACRIRIQTFDGKEKYILTAANPIFGPHGEILGSVGINQDITDPVKATQALEESKKRLEEALKIRDEFISVASHELRTPLASLMAQFQLLQRGIDKKDLKVYLPERVGRLSQ